MWQPPDGSVQVEVLESEGGEGVGHDDTFEGPGGVVGDVGYGDGLWVGQWS